MILTLNKEYFTFYQQFWANFRSVHLNSKNKICEFFLSPSDLRQQEGKVREIFIKGMNLCRRMRNGNSSLLGCERMPIWAIFKAEKDGVTTRAGTQVLFSSGQDQHLPRKEDLTVSCIIYDAFWLQVTASSLKLA